MTAARTGRPEPLTLLLAARRQRPNAAERSFGETALMWAAGHNHAEVIRAARRGRRESRCALDDARVPEVKVDLATMVTTALPRGGMTALMYAARQGAARLGDGAGRRRRGSERRRSRRHDGARHRHHQRALRRGGAAGRRRAPIPNIGDSAGMAALYAAVDMAAPGAVHQPAVAARRRAVCRRRTSSRCCSSTARIRTLTLQGAAAHAAAQQRRRRRSGDGATPLMRAAKAGDVELMRVLLEHGANPSLALREPDDDDDGGGVGARRAAR